MNKRILGFAIIAVALAAIGLWELWGRENLAYQPVLVLKEDLQANTIVSADHLKIKKMESPAKNALGPEARDNIVGMKTCHYVAEGTELRQEYFCISDLAVGKDSGKSIFSVPMEWLLSCPQTLRRGDEITLYNGKVKLLEAVVIHAKDSGSQEVINGDHERLSSSGSVSQVEIIGEDTALVELAKSAAEGNRFTLLTTR